MSEKAVIPDDWEGEYCCYAISWPKSPQWEAVLRGIVTIPRTGRFWDENTGYIKGTQAIVEPTLNWNLQLWEVIMSCGDTGIADALQNIAVALAMQAQAGSGGSGGCGGNGSTGASSSYCFSGTNVQVQTTITFPDGTNWPMFGNEPIAELPEGSFPNEYDDLAHYDRDKCAKANKIVDDYIATMRNIALTSWVTGAIGAAGIVGALVGVITLPAVVIPLLLFALVANQTLVLALNALAEAIEENKNDLICILYEGETIIAVTEGINEFLDDLITSIPAASGIAVIVKSVALWLIGSDVLNMLFTNAAIDAYPDASCACQEGEWAISIGEYISGDFINTLTIRSVHRAAGQGCLGCPARQEVRIVIPNNALPCRIITSTSVSGWVSGNFGANFADWGYYSCESVWTYGFTNPEIGLNNVCVFKHPTISNGSAVIGGADANVFEVTFTFGDPCT